MNQVDKKYMILGSLCALLLMLVVGYAAFSTLLNIKGTTNINSNWDVKITDIKKVTSKGSTDAEGTPKFDNLSATFNTNFTTPGDYATYKIEITNNGSLDAKLTKITMPENTNNDIIFYLNKDQSNTDIANVLKQNDTLFKAGETGNVGYVYVTVLYRDYENQKTAENKSANMTITFDFQQADIAGTVTPDPGFTGTVYSRNILIDDDVTDTNYIKPGDSIEKIKGYTEDYNTLNHGDFLKHIINNGQVESSEVCFVKNGLHCLVGGDEGAAYETNKTLLLSVFEDSECNNFGDGVNCQDGSFNVSIYSSGYVFVDVGSDSCKVFDEGAFCRQY